MLKIPSQDRSLLVVEPGASTEMRQAAAPTADDVAPWIRGDFNEMPDLRVTTEQAARLWGIDPSLAKVALAQMVDAGFLVCAGNVYRRTT